MSRSKLTVLLLLLALAVPAVSYADHISIEAQVSLRLAERTGSDSWAVEVNWSAECRGVGAGGASYQGNLYLIDLDSGERIYLGGVSSRSGSTRQIVRAGDEPRRMRAELRISCFDNDSLHGSGTSVIVSSGVLFVPQKELPPDVDPDFRGGGRGGTDPTEPAGTGGCREVIQGTSGPDQLTGTAAPEVIFGFNGADVIRGRGGHDCLIGSRGDDRLLGQDGFDRLTGGSGRDRLVGGAGVNAYDAGPGRDFVDARNRRREVVRCGSGRDTARVDRRDRVRSCERVRRPR